jgi:DNA-binding NarL/FixJ family response regulator
MRSKILLVSRHTKLLPLYKSFFESMGFSDVHVTDRDKDGLNMLVNDMKPRRIFIDACHYSIGTPYMVGLLHEMFPKIKITAAAREEYPDELAAWLVFHGADSYINLLDGIDEFKNGIMRIVNGENYYSPVINDFIYSLDEWPDCKSKVSRRQREVLLMICNGYSKERIGNELQISDFTVHYHTKELMKIFHVHTKIDLIKTAICLDIVNKNCLCFHENRELIASLPDWAKTQRKMNRCKREKRNTNEK